MPPASCSASSLPDAQHAQPASAQDRLDALAAWLANAAPFAIETATQELPAHMQLPPAAGTRRQRLSNSEAVQQLISATQSLELGHTSSQEASLAHAKQLLSRKQQIARATISATGPDGKACTFHPTGISDHDAATQELADSIECLAEGKMVGPYPAYADEQQAIVKACIADGNGDVYGSADNGGFARQPFGLWSGVLTFPVRDDDTVTNDPDSSLFDAPAPSPPESLPAER